MGDDSGEERRLIQRAVSGDRESFGVLYQRYLERIYRYVYLRVGNEDDAQDLTGQVFLNAWEALPAFRWRGVRLVHWLYRIAHNLVVDFHRQNRAVPSLPLDEEADWLDPPASSLERLIQIEQNAALASAIMHLTEEHQQIIVLRFIEGLKHAEIARIIEKSEISSRVMQYQALVALNRLLSDVRESEWL